MISGALFTLFSNLALIIFGIAVFTIGFFSSHTTASSWVGAQVKTARAQASSLYLFFYYLGGSVTGTLGGLFWSAYGWEGIIGTISLLLLLAIAITVRLTIYSGNINNGQEVEKGVDDLSFSAKA
jgi:YNFM family putative membrane transporter